MDDRPAAMYRNGRPVDPVFEPEENLYLRIEPEHFDEEHEKPLATCFRCPNQSVNRGKYSDAPEWILIPKYYDWGVAKLEVRQIPTPIQTPEVAPRRFLFAPKHLPDDNNYAHSEIKVYTEGLLEKPRTSVAKTVKLEYRMRLSDTVVMLRFPRRT